MASNHNLRVTRARAVLRVKTFLKSKIRNLADSCTQTYMLKRQSFSQKVADLAATNINQKGQVVSHSKAGQKVAIVTHYGNNNHNVGALLQALALLRTVEGMGFDCVIVNKRTEYLAQNRRRRTLYRLLKFAKRVVKQPSVIVEKVAARIAASKLQTQALSGSISQRCKLFAEFEDFIPHTKEYTDASIGELNDIFDICITGSDVVFGNALYNRDPYWLLAFANNKTKISYGASIEDWHEETFSRNDVNFFKKYLSDFAGVSLRESGATALFRSFGLNAKHVLDPTLLKDTSFYDNLVRPASIPDYHGEPFVLCYFVKESGYAKAKIADYCRRKALRMVLLPHLQGRFSIEDDKYKKSHVYAGPREFLWLLKNCELVFSTSYHGTCLSILYHKQFCTFQPGLGNMKKSSDFNELVCRTRLGSLLSLTGLLDRCFDIKQFPGDDVIISPIDYTAVESILSEQRNYSMRFLKDGLLGR